MPGTKYTDGNRVLMAGTIPVEEGKLKMDGVYLSQVTLCDHAARDPGDAMAFLAATLSFETCSRGQFAEQAKRDAVKSHRA